LSCRIFHPPLRNQNQRSLTFELSTIASATLVESASTFINISSIKPAFLDLFVWHEDCLQVQIHSSCRTIPETPKSQISHRMASTKLSFKAVAATILLCIAYVNAHMVMVSPAPYGKSTLTNSPLAADGSDFPCKQRAGVYDAEGASNTMTIGQPQTLSFMGSAVHGGGSCQVSLSTDLQPTASSKWMVIQSVQGNCPSNVTGNLPDDASGLGAADFQYTIPAGISPGQYTIAWSWVNKVGNREFYMNCGPATIVAAKKRYAPAAPVSKRQNTFPAMYVANLKSVNTCTTVEGDDVLYPDPGSSVVNGTISTNLQLPPACNVAAGGAAGTPSSAAPAATSSGVGVGTPSASSAPGFGSSSSSAASPGVFATGTASAAPLATSTAVVSPIPASSAPAAASSVASAGVPATSGTTTTAGAQSGACTNEGAWFCLADGSSFQRCASGVWSTPMAMAAGTTCTPGMSSSLSMTAGKSKRFSNHVRRAHRLADALST
jgi:hypothetical protein